MSKEPREIGIEVDRKKFSCTKHESGAWHCYGNIDGISYELKFPNSGPTHVFQHIENLVKNRI